MSKTKTSTNELVSNILGDKKPQTKNVDKDLSLKKKNITYNKYDDQNFKERKNMKKENEKKQQTISIIVSEETFNKLQEMIYLERLEGNRSFSISKLGRTLFEDWLQENYKK